MAESISRTEDLRLVHEADQDSLRGLADYLDELHSSSVASKGLSRGYVVSASDFRGKYVSVVPVETHQIGEPIKDVIQRLTVHYYHEKEQRPLKNSYYIIVETIVKGAAVKIVGNYLVEEYSSDKFYASVQRCNFYVNERPKDLDRVEDLPNDSLEPMQAYDLQELLVILGVHHTYHSVELETKNYKSI